jgi:hypothetical protein
MSISNSKSFLDEYRIKEELTFKYKRNSSLK